MNSEKNELPPIEGVAEQPMHVPDMPGYGTRSEAQQSQMIEQGVPTAAPPNDQVGIGVSAAAQQYAQGMSGNTPINQTSGVGVSTQQSTPPANDSELIEKEWVERAKNIVASTKDNPYAQNKELTKLKADYLLRRYNKEIKLLND